MRDGSIVSHDRYRGGAIADHGSFVRRLTEERTSALDLRPPLPCWLAGEFVHVTLLFNTVKGEERRAAAIADAPLGSARSRGIALLMAVRAKALGPTSRIHHFGPLYTVSSISRRPN
jgi:hypothetical protein